MLGLPRMRALMGRRGGGSTPLLPFTDTFDRGDGDLANGWEYTAGKWTIASGAAKGTPTVGPAELVTNGTFDANIDNWSDVSTGTGSISWNPAGSLQLNGVDADNKGWAEQQIAVTPHGWYQFSWVRPGGSVEFKIGSISKASNVLSVSAGGTWVLRSAVAAWFINAARGGVVTVDTVSNKLITLADMFATRDLGSANVDISIPVRLIAGTKIGAVLCLDQANPQNFLKVTHDGTNLVLADYVGGTRSPLISAAAAYADDRIIRAVKDGDQVAVYYNGAQIGLTQDITGKAYVNNTRHGMFTSYLGNSFGSFTAVAA